MVKINLVLIFVVLLGGCATGLNSFQEREYMAFEQDNVLVHEKNPTTGGWLGLLPGGGSFYAREPGFGMVSLLFWPLSILWDPVSGVDGSKAINYHMTKAKLERQKKAEIQNLDDELLVGKIDHQTYVLEKRKVVAKHTYTH